MQTATESPAQVPSTPGQIAKPQANIDTGAFTLDKTQAATRNPASAAQPCSHCQSPEPWGGSAWCPHCGFYPKLGICIPVDALNPLPEEKKLESGEIPKWVWSLAAGAVVILVVSIFARMQVPEDGPRTMWTMAQVGLGLFLLGLSHVQAYTISASKNEKLGVMDLFAAPAAVWRGAFESLPDTSWLVTRGSWGLVAILCGFLVVGGLGYEEINDMIAAKAANQKKFKPLAMIAKLSKGKGAPKSGGPENVEDAMNALVQELGVENLQAGGAPVAEEAAGLRKQCAIVGYTQNVDGDLKSVLLATVSGGRPDAYVTKLPVSKMPANISARLAAVLPEMRTSRPSVNCPINAYWVKPDLTCTMAFEQGAENNDWSDVKFVEMLNAAGVNFDPEQTAEILDETQKTLEQSLPQLQNTLGGN